MSKKPIREPGDIADEGGDEREQDTQTQSEPAQQPSEVSQLDYAPLVKLMRGFLGKLPTQSGSYTPTEAEQEQKYDLPDGLYRLEGTDWIFTLQAGAWTEASRATPPHFGGPDVVMVPAGG